MAEGRIKVLDPNGVLPVELHGLEPIEAALPPGWLAYAGLELIDPRNPNLEFDLVLVTHDKVLIVELKHWYGTVTSSGGQWYQNGSLRGKSPVAVTGEKAKILKEHLKRRDSNRFGDVYVDMRVVFTAGTDFSGLEQQEKDYIFPIDEFVRTIKSPNVYRKYFGENRRASPLYGEKDAFNRFFIGKDFKAAEQKYHGFRADGPPTFEHPEKLFAEYQAVHTENPRRRALLRLWSAQELAIRYQTPAERDRLFKREGRVLTYLTDSSPDLRERNCLPVLIAEPSHDESSGTFYQLFDLSTDRVRLPQFVARHESKLSEQERLAAIRALLSITAEIHRTGVAHCDLGDHNLWFGRDARVVITGFTAAQYPEEGTLGSARSSLVASHMRLPEDVLGGGSTGFCRDVFHIAVAAYRLAFLEPPPLEEEVPHWHGAPRDFCGGAFDEWFKRALDHDYTVRPQNAIELAEGFARADTKRSGAGQAFDVSKLLRFQTDVVPFAKYPVMNQVPSTQAKVHYESRSGELPVHVKVFTEARTDRDPAKAHAVYRLLATAQQWQQAAPGYAPVVTDLGLSTLGAFSVETKVNGAPVKEADLADAKQREAAALWIALEVRHLHALGLSHGDLCDRNILLSTDGPAVERISEALAEIRREARLPKPSIAPFLIDTIEYVPPGGVEPHTPAFAPSYANKCSTEERDRYAVHMLVARLLRLGATRHADAVLLMEGESRYKAVRSLLERELNGSAPILRLDPLIDELIKLVNPPPSSQAGFFNVSAPNINKPGSIDGSVDGLFAQLEMPEQSGGYAKITLLSSSPDGLEIEWDLKKSRAVALRIRRVPFHVFSRLANSHDSFRVKAVLNYANGPFNLGALEGKLAKLVHDLPEFKANREREKAEREARLAALKKTTESLPSELPERSSSEKNEPDTAPVSVARLWRTLLEVEADLMPRIEVKECRRRNDELFVAYGDEVVSFPEHDEVTVRRAISGNRTRIVGRLDLSASRAGELVIRRADSLLSPGDVLYLESKLAKASYDRRLAATDRILRGDSRESRLKSWLDPSAPWPTVNRTLTPRFSSVEELASEYGLNIDQGKAIWGAITGPPVVLVQGPPGTGKTTFIAALCHYLTEVEGASNVLVASQSHEAVDNAAEAIATLYHKRKATADLVRVGSTEQVAADLSPFHASTWRQIFLHRFDVEWTTRLESMAKEIGVDETTFSELLKLIRHTGPLIDTYESLERRISSDAVDPDEREALKVDRDRALSRIQQALGLPGLSTPRRAYEQALLEAASHAGTANPRALKQLENLVALAFEWRDVLAMSDSRFDEFLVKTKQIVCGTCVGLGATSYGLADAKYDWVIVDEAGRCTPSELAVAVQSGHRLILVGDHLQLPPFFDDQIRSAIREQFPAVPDRQLFVSDFERVFERFKAQGAGYSLLQQHRMAPAIGELVSTVFYDRDLVTARGAAAEWTRSLPEDLSEEVVWIDTSAAGSAAFEGKEPYTKSYLNRFEAEVIVRLLEEIDASDAALEVLLDPTRPMPIGVICPYAAQARVIRNLLAKSSVSPALQSRIKVGTVDSYQGKQNDLIFLSLTRANSRGDVGFVRDRARANVSLSRAKERLVIVGAAQTWGHARAINSPFGEVLEFVRARAGTPGFAVATAKHKERRE